MSDDLIAGIVIAILYVGFHIVFDLWFFYICAYSEDIDEEEKKYMIETD